MGFLAVVGIAGNHGRTGEQQRHCHSIGSIDEVVGIDLTDERLRLPAVFFMDAAEAVIVEETLAGFVVAQKGVIPGKHW